MSTAARRRQREKWTAEQIARASYYTACLFLGRGRIERRRADTLDGARAAADSLLEEYSRERCGSDAAIYAVTGSCDMTVFVESRGLLSSKR